jgi:hypothetical protein
MTNHVLRNSTLALILTLLTGAFGKSLVQSTPPSVSSHPTIADGGGGDPDPTGGGGGGTGPSVSVNLG